MLTHRNFNIIRIRDQSGFGSTTGIIPPNVPSVLSNRQDKNRIKKRSYQNILQIFAALICLGPKWDIKFGPVIFGIPLEFQLHWKS